MLSRRTRAFLLSAGLFAAVAPTTAEAQFRRLTELVLAPPTSLSPDDVLAVDVNPAALALLDGWGLRYTHFDAARSARILRQGDSLIAAGPLPFGLAFGAGLESVRPTPVTGAQARGVASAALAFAPSSSLSLGATVRYFSSLERPVSDLAPVDLGISWRPRATVAVNLIARDLNGPLRLAGAGVELPASFVLGTAVRPSGNDHLTVELAGAADTRGNVGARTFLEVRLPSLGRLHAVGEWNDVGGSQSELRGWGGLAIDWGRTGVGGGILGGEGTGGTVGWYTTARLEAVSRQGIATAEYVADVEVRGALTSRKLLGLTAQLDRFVDDDRARGVLLRLRETEIGLADAQELRGVIGALQSAGKVVACHLDDASAAEYYACSSAERVWLDPAGGLRVMGLALRVTLLGELLERAGLKAQFVRVGRYKSAPEQLTRTESSEPARLQRKALLDDAYRRLIFDLAHDRGWSEARARTAVDAGPYLAGEAVEAALSAGVADELDLSDSLQSTFGTARLVTDPFSGRASRQWGPARRIGVAVIDGRLVDGDNVDIPFAGIHLTGGRTAARAIERLATDPTVAAIVVRIDSPGGSVMASDQIWRALKRARKKKPVIASLGSVAASGGYYVASAADEIWANPSTLTGSIGVFFGKVSVAGLSERLGVRTEFLERGRHAGASSLWRPFRPHELRMIEDKVHKWYRFFLRRVSEGRGMDPTVVDRLGQGRVWSGDAALQHGLVDRLGGFASALARARQLADLPQDAELLIVPSRPESLLDYVFGTSSSGARASSHALLQSVGGLVPTDLHQALEVAVTLARTSEGIPLAMLPALYAW